MGGQAALAGPVGGLLQVGHGHDMPAPGVFQAQQAAAGKVGVQGLDRRGHVGQGHLALRVLGQGLGLDAAQHRGPAALIAIRVGVLPHQVFVPPFAMRHQCAQIALGARRHEQGRFFAGERGQAVLQSVHRRVVPKHIVTHGGRGHGLAHGGRGLGHGITAQVNGFHAAPVRKFFNMAWPCSVKMDSG